jgi:hypothetical protein
MPNFKPREGIAALPGGRKISRVRHMTLKTLMTALLLSFLTACGTAVKVQTSGDIDLNRVESGRAMVPVLLQYKFALAKGQHELFFWDENKNRFNVKILPEQNTEQGVVIYLPAGQRYALSGFLKVTPSGRQEYSMGENLDLFKIKPGKLNALPYFELLPGDENGFRFYQDKNFHRTEAKKSFPGISEVNEIHADLIDKTVTR